MTTRSHRTAIRRTSSKRRFKSRKSSRTKRPKPTSTQKRPKKRNIWAKKPTRRALFRKSSGISPAMPRYSAIERLSTQNSWSSFRAGTKILRRSHQNRSDLCQSLYIQKCATLVVLKEPAKGYVSVCQSDRTPPLLPGGHRWLQILVPWNPIRIRKRHASEPCNILRSNKYYAILP